MQGKYFPTLGTELRSGAACLNLAGSPALAKLPGGYSPGRAVSPSHGSHGTGGTQACSPSRWKEGAGETGSEDNLNYGDYSYYMYT